MTTFREGILARFPGLLASGLATMHDIREANEAAGLYWFSPDTLRFFRSRISEEVYGAGYFVSSELDNFPSMPNARRRYTVRRAKPNGSIETVSRFHQYASRSAAHAAARRFAASQESGGHRG